MRKYDTRSQSGFSLIEMLVSLIILSVIVLAALELFDRGNKMTKTETSVSDAQQSSRYASYEIVRMARMAGSGGYPPSSLDVAGTYRQQAVALNLGSHVWGTATKYLVNNVNVGGSDLVCLGAACGNASAHHIRSGTDILHVRGVMTNAVYDLSGSSWTGPAGSGTTGTLVIEPCTKYTDPSASGACAPYGTNDMSLFPVGGPYPTGKLFIMTDPLGNSGVGKITACSAISGGSGTIATVTVDVGSSSTPDGVYWQTLSANGQFPSAMTNPSRGGVLDDRVYFIDDGTSTGKTCTALSAVSPGPCHPVLSVADWVDGDSAAAPFSTATVTPIADDIEDLQIAYGVDFFDLTNSLCNTASNCTLASPAPASHLDANGNALPEADGSISIANVTTFNTNITSARGTTAPNSDPSEDTSGADKDEWIWNAAGEPGTGTFDYTSDISRLKALEINVVAKGTDPELNSKFLKIGATEWLTMDSAATSVSKMLNATSPKPFRRRLTTVRVNLRNFQVQ